MDLGSSLGEYVALVGESVVMIVRLGVDVALGVERTCLLVVPLVRIKNSGLI